MVFQKWQDIIYTKINIIIVYIIQRIVGSGFGRSGITQRRRARCFTAEKNATPAKCRACTGVPKGLIIRISQINQLDDFRD